MSKIENFLSDEKDYYGKVFIDINYAIDNVSSFIDEDTLKARKYFNKIEILTKYMELLDSTKAEIQKSGFFGFLNNDKYINLLQQYKKDNHKSLEQLYNCSKCSCLNCSAECKFESCSNCREGSCISFCDHKKINVTKHTDFTLDLTNNRTGEDEKYIVLATLEDTESKKLYIIVEGILSKEKFILYYYPGIVQDTFGEISNEDEFNFIASTYEFAEK